MIRLLRIGKSLKPLEILSSYTSARIIQASRLVSSDSLTTESTSNPTNTSDPAESSEATEQIADLKVDQSAAETNTLPADDITIPWYLRDEIKSTLLDEKEITLPEIPPHAPAHVLEFLNLLATDYGMENLLLFDMTTLDETHEFKANNVNVDFIIISTGKSERHILKASTEFRTHIKHKYQVLPSTEGIVSTAKTPAMRRKLLRRARKGPSSTDNDYGRAANSWVLFHHENVDVHIMTAERRQDLNLESIWCRPEDLHLYEQKLAAPVESDHIFSGIRYLHTRAGRRNYSSIEGPKHHLQTLLSLPVNVGLSELKGLKSQFDSEFSGTSVENYGIKYQFYKTLHLHCPELVSFQEVESVLLEKYASTEILSEDLSRQKLSDVTEYAKLLLDSSSTQLASVESTDTALDKLSLFISVLYRFSSEKFSMSKDPEFIPLLWRLTFCSKGDFVTPGDIDQFIKTRDTTIAGKSGEPLIALASNNARNVLTLIDFHNKTIGNGSSITPAFQELVLYTYGNAGKWKKFWEEWDSMFFPNTPLPLSALEMWVRLVTYLLIVSNHSQSLHFLDYCWRNGSGVSGSFMECLDANKRKFNSKDEKDALLKAMYVMVDSLDPKKDIFVEMRKQLLEMQSTD